MEQWQGPCRSCGQSGSGAVMLVYRGAAHSGLCPACARDPVRLRAFVAVAEAFRRGLGPDGSRNMVRLERRAVMPAVLFAQLVPRDLRVPGAGRPPRTAPAAAQQEPGRAARVVPVAPGDALVSTRVYRLAQRFWQRLRRALHTYLRG